MFEIGDYIIYGNNGVCEVIKVGNLEMGSINKNKLYYTLQPVYDKGSVIYTPVENGKVTMRKALSKEEADKLIDDIPGIEAAWEDDNKLREILYKELMKKQDCRDLIKIIKTVYLRKEERLSQGKKITSVDEKYTHAAENCLYGELSISLNMPKEEIENFIVTRIEALKQE